ncbi:hypothetical protein BBP00_00001920 [Phytophthora kernoviae]|uniref:Fungal lipase-type domain-containing protein n=1 Tax=Phytophthora kernoviae TaxID=325452 RepID=A0A3F2S0E7_9STRA|nr:hypothetical protein BBP00_00001920 [Phytophthora kernoviae]
MPRSDGHDRRRGASLPPLGDEETEEDRIYRPLLFQSTGYASSELFRDSYEMHSRLPVTSATAPLLGVVELPGGLCKKEDGVRREPCIDVDKTRDIAQWTAYISNVSRYAGSIEIKLDVREQVNTSSSAELMSNMVESNTLQELERNPVYAISELYTNVSMRTRFVSITCESLAEAFFYVFWLNLMDQHSRDFSLRRCAFSSKLVFGLALFGVDLAMIVLRMPKLFFGAEVVPSSHEFHPEELYVLLGFIHTGLMLAWLGWIMAVGARSGRHLKELPYMATRFKQLSYRFLVLQTLLILVYVFVLSALQIFYLVETWYFVGYNAFIQDAVHTFAKLHAGHSSLGKFLFLSVYVYLVMFVHMPPLAGNSTGLLTSTAFHVDEKPRVDSYGFLTSDSNLFCVETAGWLLEMAYQAYFDPPGRPSPSGYGELNLEQHGFELITHLRSSFWLAYESIREELKVVTRLILDENPGVSVYITGHSMGGSLAILAAYDLAVNFSIKVNMYNFGGPRVGTCFSAMDYDDQQAQEGVIRSHVELAEAAANGSRAMVEFLLDNGVHIDSPGKDGTTPLCAAALWGNNTMVSYLLDKGADVAARNEGTGWTALHAATFQEHGKVVQILLGHQADPKVADTEGRRPVDYASISEAIWPFFAAQGYSKSLKSDLIIKGIIRKIPDQPEQTQSGDKYADSISSFSRPGSSYVRAQMAPPLGRRQPSALKSLLNKGSRVMAQSLRAGARNMSSASEQEAKEQMHRWTTISKGMIGVVAVFTTYTAVDHMNHGHHHDEVPDYPYLKMRNKPFPWPESDCDWLDLDCREKVRAAKKGLE